MRVDQHLPLIQYLEAQRKELVTRWSVQTRFQLDGVSTSIYTGGA